MAGQAPPPPPSIPSGQSDAATVRAVVEWLWAFYNSTIRGNYLATSAALSSLEDTVDPASATVATAQETANTALSLATTNDTRLDAIKVGSVTIVDTVTVGEIVLAEAFEDENYYVTATPSAKVGTPAVGSRDIDVITKTSEKVTLTVQIAPGSGNSVTFDVMAIRP